jgi:hypothetical protein
MGFVGVGHDAAWLDGLGLIVAALLVQGGWEAGDSAGAEGEAGAATASTRDAEAHPPSAGSAAPTQWGQCSLTLRRQLWRTHTLW